MWLDICHPFWKIFFLIVVSKSFLVTHFCVFCAFIVFFQYILLVFGFLKFEYNMHLHVLQVFGGSFYLLPIIAHSFSGLSLVNVSPMVSFNSPESSSVSLLHTPSQFPQKPYPCWLCFCFPLMIERKVRRGWDYVSELCLGKAFPWRVVIFMQTSLDVL